MYYKINKVLSSDSEVFLVNALAIVGNLTNDCSKFKIYLKL